MFKTLRQLFVLGLVVLGFATANVAMAKECKAMKKAQCKGECSWNAKAKKCEAGTGAKAKKAAKAPEKKPAEEAPAEEAMPTEEGMDAGDAAGGAEGDM